ncbi:MAG: hypothetical protein U0Q55_11265 [Vicinamibacterales bacterium]
MFVGVHHEELATGRYSQRNRRLLLKMWSLEAYWTSALANMRGEKP